MNYRTPSDGLPTVIAAKQVAANLSQNALADLAGIPRPTFVRRMRRGDFTVIELHDVATALNTTAAALMADAEKSAA